MGEWMEQRRAGGVVVLKGEETDDSTRLCVDDEGYVMNGTCTCCFAVYDALLPSFLVFFFLSATHTKPPQISLLPPAPTFLATPPPSGRWCI